jgi:gliding motility-associated protein GldM
MALPKEPRQKMINLMYLVLTALLALNVSAEILNAFRTVNGSLEKTNLIVNNSTGNYMASLQKKLGDPESHDRAAIWFPIAQNAQNLSNAAYKQVQDLKDSLLHLSGFNPAKNHDSTFKEDDINVPEHLMVEGGAGKKLFTALSNFKQSILSINPEIGAELAPAFPLDLTPPKSKNKGSNTWEGAYFHMTPTIAALTILSKFQNDIRTAENKFVEACHKKVGQVENVFDAYAPIIEQSATYVMNGQELEVTAGLGAFNSKNQPTISIDGQSEATGADGLVSKKFVASGVGQHSVHVVITYKDQSNKVQTITKDVTYTVGEPTGIKVSAEKVKVLYIGLENPLSISAGSAGSEKISATIDNGTITKGTTSGEWIAKPATPGMATVNVSIDGKTTPFPFRVKSVPDPVGIVGNNKGGRMRVNEFKAQFGVGALLDNFVFDGVKFQVASYTIVCTGAGFPILKFENVNGDSFDPIRSTIIEQTRAGTTVTIDNIKAVGPGGTRTLPPIVYNLF